MAQFAGGYNVPVSNCLIWILGKALGKGQAGAGFSFFFLFLVASMLKLSQLRAKRGIFLSTPLGSSEQLRSLFHNYDSGSIDLDRHCILVIKIVKVAGGGCGHDENSHRG
jgi:hypothetical protein